MPRRPRRTLESGYLHIMVQGINRENIFEKEANKRKYYSLLVSEKEENDIDLLTYCIMDNHAHIVTYVNKIENVSQYMNKVNSAYAIYYNKQNNRVGYVFRDRYKSKAIKDEWYLFNCITYVHFNPVKAGIVKNPSEYKYSSYNDLFNNTGIASNKVIKLIFGGVNDYKKMFEFIHSIDVDDNYIEKNDSTVCYPYNIESFNKEKLKEECMKLKRKNFSNREIAKILGINRNKVDRVIK